jgi:hypothetical protein
MTANQANDLLEQLEEMCENHYWHFKEGKATKADGDIDDVYTTYLEKFGLDSEVCLEVYDDHICGNASANSATKIVRNIRDASGALTAKMGGAKSGKI